MSSTRLDPDRTVSHDAKPYGTSFGAGRHVCIGRPIALPNVADDGAATQGSMVRMLHALYANGAVPDPDEPRATPESARQDFRQFPVVFTDLP